MGENIYFKNSKWGSRGSKDTVITRMLSCSLIVCGMGRCMLLAEYLWLAKQIKIGCSLYEIPVFCIWCDKILCEGEGWNCTHFWAYRYFSFSFTSLAISYSLNLSLKLLHSLCVFCSSVVKRVVLSCMEMKLPSLVKYTFVCLVSLTSAFC